MKWNYKNASYDSIKELSFIISNIMTFSEELCGFLGEQDIHMTSRYPADYQLPRGNVLLKWSDNSYHLYQVIKFHTTNGESKVDVL